MKNNFLITIINNKTNKSIALNLSNLLISIVVSIFTFFLICLIYFGFHYNNALPYEKQQQNIFFEKQKLMEIINILDEKKLLNDSLLTQHNFLEPYYKTQYFGEIIKPLNGIITQGVIQNKNTTHSGLDIAAPFKEPIQAIQDGFILFSGNTKKLGNTVIIAHANNLYSIYGHMHKVSVRERDFISQGYIIGYVGADENEEGPHLHFEIWHNNLIIDPRNLIKEYKVKDVSIR